MRFDVLTLFPEMFSGISASMVKRAEERGIVEIHIHNFRDFSTNKHKRVDDYPYGGGAGLIIGPQAILDCMRSIDGHEAAYKILFTPSGNLFTQKKAREISEKKHVILLCGHYEGIDRRVSDYVDEEISIGDFVLTGGEIPAMAVIDSVTRLLPGALGNEESPEFESFNEYLLEHPQYTRPEEYEGKRVPEVLLSGHHEKVRQYRRFKSLQLTYLRRPDLLEKADLTDEDRKFLEMIKRGEEL
ncbi:MAG TPA: tRNA (guanosine(37)-N1)-methyltransferase TrmD [Acholeplasmataceae bacterium]|jgi:tRNA (guanine37-N1)-methyltransferase|nr:tRNA (guanosine(37)-N1)-methyltransferase TrmD [Acholeplasmataceae bacterium]